MPKTHKITWLGEHGVTWNPTVGCTKVSAGCKNCYAERMARRQVAMENSDYRPVVGPDGKWNDEVNCLESRLDIPLRWRKPRRVFVDSMSDLFHENVPYEFIESVFGVMRKCPQHIFIILTKRSARMRSLARMLNEDILPNLWLGVTVENTAMAKERLPWLLRTPAAKRIISFEPALELVDWEPWLATGKIDWLICGGETGPGARPMNFEWARKTRDVCIGHGVPFFFKQWGSVAAKGRTCPEGYEKTSDFNRLLDGLAWDQVPKEVLP